MRKQRLLAALFLMALLAPQATHAQFLKNLFGGNKHKQVHKAPVPPAKPKIKKKQEAVYPPTVRKNRYRVDVLAQLHLNDLVKDDKPVYKDKMPENATTGIAFCQGAMLAIDTLRGMGYDMDVFIHDVTDPASTASALIGSKELDTSSLIIGAVGAKDIQEVANFARAHHINFISALSSSDAEVKNNIFFTMLQPSQQQHCAFIKKELLKKYPEDKVTLFYRNNLPADENAYKYLLAKDSAWSVRKVLCNELPEKEVLDNLFDSTVTNVVVMSITENKYADKLLALLSQGYPAYHFEVYGMPSWKAMATIHKADTLANLGINISAPFYFNQNSPAGQYLEHSFREKFNGHTSEMVYRGYETAFWYAMLLHQYGTVFNTRVGDIANTAFTPFLIKPEWKDIDLLYNQNEHLYLYRYQGGSYMMEP